MWINKIAGRSYKDVTQYPIFPWIIKQYFISQIPQKNNQINFRDLTKNIGSQGSQQRKIFFLNKFQEQNQFEIFNQYHFGSHYSSSGVIFNFLIRLKPFSDGAKILQSGCFDVADRLFYSLQWSWTNCQSSISDVRQLTPQFFFMPQIFINLCRFNFGLTQDKQIINSVILPKWSKNNPYLFINYHRQFLESQYVSNNLNFWIDLIFGQDQKGQRAIQKMNLFHPLTYQDSINLDSKMEYYQLNSYQSQIAHFGQTPSQILFNTGHIKRKKISLMGVQYGRRIVDLNSKINILLDIQIQQKKLMQKNKIQKYEQLQDNAIIKIKFISNKSFLILRKNGKLLLMSIQKKKNQHNLVMKKQIKLILQSKSQFLIFDNSQFDLCPPIILFQQKFIIIGSYNLGKVNVIDINHHKKNLVIKQNNFTIVSLALTQKYKKIAMGNTFGQLYIIDYSVIKQFKYNVVKKIHDHQQNITCITFNDKFRCIITCGRDGKIFMYNIFDLKLIRQIYHVDNYPIEKVLMSTIPIYSLIFFSSYNSSIYSYSINGQFLSKRNQEYCNIIDPTIIENSNLNQILVKIVNQIYCKIQKQILMYSLPFLIQYKRIKIMKQCSNILSMDISKNRCIAAIGSIKGGCILTLNIQILI